MNGILNKALIFCIFLSTQWVSAQTTTPPEMPIPPEVQNTMPPPPEVMTPPPPPDIPANSPEVNPAPQLNSQTSPSPPQEIPTPPQSSVSTGQIEIQKPKMPAEFDLIVIKPYFKNKPKLGHLTATLYSSMDEVLGSVSGDFGDCANCIRGASIRGMLGVRLYGSEVSKLTVSRKQSTSIRLGACNANNNMALVNNTFTCEFTHKNLPMKLILKLVP